MYRIDSFCMIVAASVVCCLLAATDGVRQFDASSRHNRHHLESVRQTTLPRIGREPLDEATGMNGGDSGGVPDLEEVDKRALRLMRIGRRSWEDDEAQQQQQQQHWLAGALGGSEEKRAMRLMRLGRRSLEDFGDQATADKRAMRLMRLGKKSVGGLYRPSFRYGK